MGGIFVLVNFAKIKQIASSAKWSQKYLKNFYTVNKSF
jgi:hypothetical protein